MSSLRFLRPDDLPLLARAVRELAPPHADMDTATLRQWMENYATRPGNCMVLWEREDLRGVLVSARREVAGRVEGLIQELWLHPEHRRQGHGLEMLGALEKKVAIMGMDTFFLEVPDEAGALAFAGAAGFAPLGRGVDAVFSLPGEENGPEQLLSLAALDLDQLPEGRGWFADRWFFERPGLKTGVLSVSGGEWAVAGRDDTLLALVPLQKNADLKYEDLLKLSQHFLWASLKNLPENHPVLAFLSEKEALLSPRWVFQKRVGSL